MTVEDRHGGHYTVLAHPRDVAGCSGILKAVATMEGKFVTSITSIDGDGKTMADQQRSATILTVLQGTLSATDYLT